MKRSVTFALMAIVLIGLVVSMTGCASDTQAQATATQTAAAQRGNLSVEITAAGNLAFSQAEDLAFEVAGTVAEVMVDDGDVVEKGKVLARLDTAEWEDHLSTLEDQWIAKQRAVTSAERDLETKKRAVTARERDVLSAQNTLTNTEKALAGIKETYSWTDVEAAQAEFDRANTYLQYALDSRADASSGGTIIWDRAVANAQAQVNAAQTKLDSVLTVLTSEEWEIKNNEVTIAKGKLEDAKVAVNDAAIAISDAETSLNDAKRAEAKAKKAYDDALATSLEIIAPFDSFITKVNVKGGDDILPGTVAVQIADPNKFEANIMVSEMDIAQVNPGGAARVTVDSMKITLPANVAHISPTATIQSGVVNYQVTVEVESPVESNQEQQTASQESSQAIQQNELPARLQQAIESGKVTREQAEAALAQIQQAQGQTSALARQNVQLREGLTVTITIVVNEKNDVVLVPNAAITRRGGQTYVKIVSASGVNEERQIKTGISNWQYTEVTEGLSEGENVIVPQGNVTSTTTQQQQGRTGGMFIPGIGGPPR